jgi:DNA-binding transcriptional MerR regulator
VRRCKVLGFSLKQIALLAQLHRAHRGSCRKLHELLAELASHLDAKRRQIENQEKAVRALLGSCDGDKPLDECEAFAKLEGDARARVDGDSRQ